MLYIFNNIEINVTVRPVRAMRLTVRPTGEVCLSVPLGVSTKEIAAFLEKNGSWLDRTLDKVRQKQLSSNLPQYVTGEMHLLWGKLLPLNVLEERGRESVAFYDDEIVMYCHADRDVAGRKKTLYQGYYRLFRPVLYAMLHKWCNKLQVEMPDVTIRLMRTEWGSCTPRKNRMTFNVDMVRLPKDCMEYVVIHEFTHLVHPNHSAAFWALCDSRLREVGLADSKTMRKMIRKTIGS